MKNLLLLLCLLLSACSAATPTATPIPVPSLTPSASPTVTNTPIPTKAPTRAPSPTPTQLPTPIPTKPPVTAGTLLPPVTTPIIELSLDQVRQLAQWGRGRVDGLAWSPTGGLIAITTPLGVYLYNAATFSTPVMLDSGAASRPTFSPDGRYLAIDVIPSQTGEELSIPTHSVQVWDISAAEPIQIAHLESGGQALDMAFHGSELLMLVRQEGGAQLQRWDFSAQTRRQALNLNGGEAAVTGVIAPNLLLAATHGEPGPVRIWSLKDAVNLATTNEQVVRTGSLAFSPDSRSLAVGYPDTEKDFYNSNLVRVWRVPEGSGALSEKLFELTAPSTGEGSEETLISLAWSPDGAYIAAGFENYRVVVWRGQGSPVYRELKGSSLPRFLAWAPQLDVQEPNPRIAAGGLEVWSIGAVGGSINRIAHVDDFLPGIFDMHFSPDGSNLALAGYGAIDFRSTANGERTLTMSGMDGPVHSIAFSPDGTMLGAACHDGTTRIFLTKNGLYLNQLGEPTYPLRAIDFSPDGRWIASTGEDSLIRVFRVKDGVQIYGVIEPYVSYQLLFSPNTDQLASLTTTGVRVRGITATEEEMRMDWESWIGGVGLTGMAYSTGQEFLALVGNDVVRVVEPLSGKDVYTLYEQNGALPWSVAFSPDNAFLAVGWSDGQIRIYWAQDGRFMRSWQAHPASVRRLTFSRDSHLLASLGEEGTIRLWGVSR
jgi:WD40 repeat protein